jgi:hypothetical protein
MNARQVVGPDGVALGFIPLNRSNVFHSLSAFPILFAERDAARGLVELVLASDVDRNALLPLHPDLDSLYTAALRSLYSPEAVPAARKSLILLPSR